MWGIESESWFGFYLNITLLIGGMAVAESETQTSWFQRYCRDYMRTLAFSEHEAIDHPISCECCSPLASMLLEACVVDSG